jgi:hypothetical protein
MTLMGNFWHSENSSDINYRISFNVVHLDERRYTYVSTKLP